MADNTTKKTQERTDKAEASNERGRMQPNAPDCEEAVIGGLLTDPQAFYEVASLVSKDSFYDKRYGLIFEAMLVLSCNHKAIDIITVANQLQTAGTLKEAGDRLFLEQLTERITSAVNIEEAAEIVAQKHVARQLIRMYATLEEMAYDPQTDIKELIAAAERNVMTLKQIKAGDGTVQVNETIDDVMSKIKEARNNIGKYTGVPSGFTELDNIIYGWQPDTLNVIAARPAMGKTAFALSMAKNMVVDYGKSVCVFSLEMTALELTTRLLVNVSEIKGDTIKKGDLRPFEWEVLQRKSQLLSDSKLYIDDTPGLSIFELCSKARRLKSTAHLDCIIIDYLQLVNANLKNGTREQEVSYVSRSLKALAKELHIPVIALAQLNRGVESRSSEDKRPMLSDLRESGAIEQDADVVVMLHRPEYYHQMKDTDGNSTEGKALVIVAKHRSGSIDDVELDFQRDFVRFSNPSNTSFQSSNNSILDNNKIVDNSDETTDPVPHRDDENPF